MDGPRRKVNISVNNHSHNFYRHTSFLFQLNCHFHAKYMILLNINLHLSNIFFKVEFPFKASVTQTLNKPSETWSCDKTGLRPTKTGFGLGLVGCGLGLGLASLVLVLISALV